MSQRRILVIGSQCEALQPLKFLPRAAQELYAVMADPERGACDRDVTPVAELLIEGRVPVIFYSGLALPAELRKRYPSACVCKKPTPLVQLLNKLVASMPNKVETVLALGAVDLPAVRSSPVY
jgi:hypothetical protein